MVDFILIRKTHQVLILAFVLLSMCFFSACSKLPFKIEITKPVADDKSVDINETSGVKVENDINEKEYLNKSSLGNVTFEIDYGNTVTAEFLADGKSVTLELTDEAGIKWTLMIPGDAMLNSQTITMTALSDIKTDSFLGKLTGGVLFETDGLRFLKPATLTISGRDITSKTFIFEGTYDGSELDYCYMNTPAGSAVSSYVFHFSSAFASNNEQFKDIYDKVQKDYNEAVQAAKTLMSEPLEILPPPAFDFRCKDNEDIASEPVDEYIKQIKNPEDEVLTRLLKAKKALALLDEKEGNLSGDRYVQGLINRQLKKINTLLKEYKSEYDKYLYGPQQFWQFLNRQHFLAIWMMEVNNLIYHQ